MGRKLVFLMILFVGLLPTSVARAQLSYWVTYTNEVGGPSGYGNSVSGTSLSDNNHVEVDIENDGIADYTFDLMASEGMSFGSPMPGTKIVADFPIQLVYYYRFSDYGTYEDGSLRYMLLPQRAIGDDYFAPIAASQAAVLSVTDGTVIYYDANNDGTPESTFNLDEGQNQVLATVAGAHLWGTNDFYFVEAEWGAGGYHHTFAFTVVPIESFDTFFVSPMQHGFSHDSVTDNSGIHVVSGADAVTVNIGVNQQILNTGEIWAFPTDAEQIVSADGPIAAVHLSSIHGTDPWGGTWRDWEYAIPLVPESYGVRELYTRGRGIDSHGGPSYQAFFASYTDGNQLDFECLTTGGTYNVILDSGETFYLRDTDTPIDCWRSETTHLLSSAPIQASFSRRSWWNSYSESTDAYSYLVHVCECEADVDCDDALFCNGPESCADGCICEDGEPPCPDDGLFCTGVESCDEDGDLCEATGDPCVDNELFCDGVESCDEDGDQCTTTGDPCPDDLNFCTGVESCDEDGDECQATGNPCVDNGLFCDGEESCDALNAECVSSGDPCPDDLNFCTGVESCDEDADECQATGDPCVDDELFCDGQQYCDVDEQECRQTGDPCQEDETCDEENDLCIGGDTPVDQGDEDAGWPEGKVTGGCCGCD